MFKIDLLKINNINDPDNTPNIQVFRRITIHHST